MEKEKFIYFISSDELTKIGISEDPQKRIKTLQVGNPIKLELMATIGKANRNLESQIHEYFNDERINGEWFRIGLIELIQFLDEFKNLSIYHKALFNVEFQEFPATLLNDKMYG